MREIENRIQELKALSEKSLRNKNFEKACAAMNAAGYASYHWNQYYKDDELEQQIHQAANMYPNHAKPEFEKDPDCVLFYDGFGLDTRGLALNYLSALLDNGKKVKYITTRKAENHQPVFEETFRKQLEDGSLDVSYFEPGSKAADKITLLLDTLKSGRAGHTFFYSLPYDVPGLIFMELIENITTRYFINLTDHAFWMGTSCADYYIDFRSYGSSINANYRNITEDKIRLLPYYPFINRDVEYTGLPFDLQGRKMIFSGGALYKTLGDEANRYYRIIDYILKTYEDTVFFYVGSGDQSELQKLQSRYPERVFYSEERKDFYHIYEDAFLYLNTFPMVGGLMMQYSAIHGVLPLTLRHGSDGDGILIDQDNLGIVFDSLESTEAEIDRLMKDDEYKKRKEAQIRSAVPTPERFRDNLKRIMDGMPTEYRIDLEPVDTQDFLHSYRERMNDDAVFRSSVARSCNKALITSYPAVFLKETVRKLSHSSAS